MKSYKISKIVKEDTTLEIILDDEARITPTIHGLPINGTKEEMTRAVKQYANDYMRGLGIEVEASDEVKALIGETVEVEEAVKEK
jgi:RNase H-fold protein (predicted Holliday junction resolvase)